MQVVLVMFRGDGERRSFSLPRQMTVVGRREDCDLRIPLHDVSRKHCRLVREEGVLRVEDLGSSNGTYHNGQRIQEAVVKPGDTVQIGPVVFVAQIDGVPADEELKPFNTQAADALTASAAGLESAELEEVEALEQATTPLDQAQTLTGNVANGFDPMEVLQSDEADSDDLVDFDITAEEPAESDDVQIPFDLDTPAPRPGDRA